MNSHNIPTTVLDQIVRQQEELEALRAENTKLRKVAEAAEKVLKARDVEARTKMTFDVAVDNFSDHRLEGEAYEAAMILASKADMTLIEALREWRGK